jgi:hypothetical protein
VAAFSFLLGCLSLTSFVPYLIQWRWTFFAVAGGLYAILGMRDLAILLDKPENSEAQHAGGRGPSNLLITDVCSAFLMIFGSVLLVNSSVIALYKSDMLRASKWQFLGCFAAYTIGYACNSMSYYEETVDVLETRNAVVFQMSLASMLNLFGALLNTPLVEAAENEQVRATVRAWLHAIAGVLAFVGTLVNHFHTKAFMLNEELLYAELKHLENIEKLAKKAERAASSRTTPPTVFQRFVKAIKDGIAQQIPSPWTGSTEDDIEESGYQSLLSGSSNTTTTSFDSELSDPDADISEDCSASLMSGHPSEGDGPSKHRDSWRRSAAEEEQQYSESASEESSASGTTASRKNVPERRRKRTYHYEPTSNHHRERKKRVRKIPKASSPRFYRDDRIDSEEHVVVGIDDGEEQGFKPSSKADRRRRHSR